jgi:Na+-translocating ferredoxin:NAD+ oxidoreductase subunit G
MSEAALQPVTPSVAMVRTLGLVATICGVLIVTAYEGTLDAVNANKKVALERAVFKVIPGAAKVDEYVATPSGIQPAGAAVPEGAIKFYAAYDPAGNLKGIAAEGAAKGYADTVRVLYAYDPAKQVINGLGVISMRETPGIGDKIYTDEAFLKNFEALDVKLAADLKALANAVKVVKHGSKQNAWEIDAISGATVTSKAVGRGINDSARKLLPLLVPNLDKLKAPSAAHHALAFPPLEKPPFGDKGGQGGFSVISMTHADQNPPQAPFKKGGSHAASPNQEATS